MASHVFNVEEGGNNVEKEEGMDGEKVEGMVEGMDVGMGVDHIVTAQLNLNMSWS